MSLDAEILFLVVFLGVLLIIAWSFMRYFQKLWLYREFQRHQEKVAKRNSITIKPANNEGTRGNTGNNDIYTIESGQTEVILTNQHLVEPETPV